MIKELILKHNSVTIYGKLYIPDCSKKPYPLVILAHGFGSNHSLVSDYAENFMNNKIACYTFDFCGGSNESLSTGNTLDMSVITETNDMNFVLNKLKDLYYIDSSNIFLMGESQGGYVSSLLASKVSEDIKGLILLYPAFVILDDAVKRTDNGKNIPDTMNVMGMDISRKYNEDALSIDIYKEIQKFKKDVLIIHGDHDTIVPLSYAEKAAKVYASSQLVVLKDAVHGFWGQNKITAAALSVEYVQKHI